MIARSGIHENRLQVPREWRAGTQARPYKMAYILKNTVPTEVC